MNALIMWAIPVTVGILLLVGATCYESGKAKGERDAERRRTTTTIWIEDDEDGR